MRVAKRLPSQKLQKVYKTSVPIVEAVPITKGGWRMFAATDVKEGVGWWYVKQTACWFGISRALRMQLGS